MCWSSCDSRPSLAPKTPLEPRGLSCSAPPLCCRKGHESLGICARNAFDFEGPPKPRIPKNSHGKKPGMFPFIFGKTGGRNTLRLSVGPLEAPQALLGGVQGEAPEGPSGAPPGPSGAPPGPLRAFPFPEGFNMHINNRIFQRARRA